jgi:hypothetical protein
VPDDLRREYPEDVHLAFGGDPSDAWERVREEADRQGMIRRRRIGQSECMLFRVRPVVAIYERSLRADPFTLFGVPRPGP